MDNFGVVLDRFPTRIGRFAEERRRLPASSGLAHEFTQRQVRISQIYCYEPSALLSRIKVQDPGWNIVSND
jgi:hypothetical protein